MNFGLRVLELEKNKKEQTYQIMLDTLAEKEERRFKQKTNEKIENQKYSEYTQQKDAQLAEVKKAKAQLEAIKYKFSLK